MDPLSGAAAGINSSIRIFEVTYQLKAVDEQTADLLSTTRHVDNNLNEARRLRRLKVTLLDADECAWIDGVIQDTDKALCAVAQLIEPARVDKNVKEGINFKNRVMWVFRDNPKVRDKHAALMLCHQSLMTVIARLYSKDSTIIESTAGSEKGEKPPPYDPQTEDLFNWRNQRRRRKSNMDLGDGNTERGTSTTSVSTNSISTGTSPTSLLGSTTPLSSCSSTLEGVERTTSTPAETQMRQTSNPLASLQENSSEQRVVADSTSTGPMVTSPLSSTVGLHGVDMERPLSSRWGSPRRKPVPYNPRLSGPDDCIPSDWLKATQESLYDVSMRPLSDPEPLQSRSLTDPYDSSTMSDFPVLNCSSRAESSNITKQPQTKDTCNTRFSNTDTVTMTSLAEINSDPSTTVFTNGYPAYENVRGLKDQKVYKPYRRPTMDQESQSFTATSSDSSSLFSSGLASRSERSHSAGLIPAYDPPRFPGDRRYSPNAFIAELEANICESATGYREQELHGQDHDMDGKMLPSETGISTTARPGRARRGRRSWLKFHATRSDLGHYIG